MKSIEHYEQLAREAKAEGCEHKNVDHVELRVNGGRDREWLVCLDCHERLPVVYDEGQLGPSNDTYPVEVEIRAAEIAAAVADTQVPPMSNAELRGYEAHANDTDGPPFFETDVGWPAREIIMHGIEEQS